MFFMQYLMYFVHVFLHELLKLFVLTSFVLSLKNLVAMERGTILMVKDFFVVVVL